MRSFDFPLLLALGAATMGATTSIAAQDRPYAGVVLRVPASTRALGMGNANVAGRDDDVVFYSPAQIAVARGTSISGERFTPTTTGGSMATVSRIGNGGIALGVSWISYATANGAYPGSRADFTREGGLGGSSFAAVLGVAQTFKGFRTGVAAKYVREELGLRQEKGLLDVGVGRDVGVFGTQLATALSVQNIGSDFSPDALLALPGQRDRTRLPLRATLGASDGRPAGPLDLAYTAQLSVLRDGFVTPAGGIEVGYSWLDGYSLALRAGGRRPESGEGTLTAGAGFQVDRLSIDYALETLAGGRTAHRIGLRIR